MHRYICRTSEAVTIQTKMGFYESINKITKNNTYSKNY